MSTYQDPFATLKADVGADEHDAVGANRLYHAVRKYRHLTDVRTAPVYRPDLREAWDAAADKIAALIGALGSAESLSGGLRSLHGAGSWKRVVISRELDGQRAITLRIIPDKYLAWPGKAAGGTTYPPGIAEAYAPNLFSALTELDAAGVDTKYMITSGYRTYGSQADLKADSLVTGTLVAAPDRSRHRWGTAIDVWIEFLNQHGDRTRQQLVRSILSKHGFYPLAHPAANAHDPIHFSNTGG